VADGDSPAGVLGEVEGAGALGDSPGVLGDGALGEVDGTGALGDSPGVVGDVDGAGVLGIGAGVLGIGAGVLGIGLGVGFGLGLHPPFRSWPWSSCPRPRPL
jgi:hypothetical protein